ncbi:MAG: hypothetical protein ACERLG_12375, partial [Sedimentibacter sp.]
MMDEGNDFLKIIKKRILILKIFILLLISVLIIIIALIINSNSKNGILLDVLSRQQILTQMISKDANRKLVILKAVSNGMFIENIEVLNGKISSLNDSLEASKIEYEANLYNFKSGILKYQDKTISFNYLYNGINVNNYIDEVESITFIKPVEFIIDNDISTLETEKAILVINTNNEQLLMNWNQITSSLIDYQEQVAKKYFTVSIILFVIFSVLLFISFFSFNKYMIEPLNELYNGIKNFGTTNRNVNNFFSTKKELKPVIHDINSMFNKLNRLIELIGNLNKDVSFDGILNYIYLSFSEFIPYSHIGIALLKEDNTILQASYGISDKSI